MSENEIIKETRPRMEAAIDDVRRKLATVRTGRASVSLLDIVIVDYYGTQTPLNQMASVHAPEPQMLTVQPRSAARIAFSTLPSCVGSQGCTVSICGSGACTEAI